MKIKKQSCLKLSKIAIAQEWEEYGKFRGYRCAEAFKKLNKLDEQKENQVLFIDKKINPCALSVLSCYDD